MSDVNTLVVEPLTKFVQDSAYLVKKCSKPDRKGNICETLAKSICSSNH
jgi:hypothetical protein